MPSPSNEVHGLSAFELPNVAITEDIVHGWGVALRLHPPLVKHEAMLCEVRVMSSVVRDVVMYLPLEVYASLQSIFTIIC